MRKNRSFQELRNISFSSGVNIHSEGSCLVKFGNTHVMCTASIEEKIPIWLRNSNKGWLTAEYGMLPRSTNTRIDRESTRGKQSGRTQEIQRLIGRSLRAIVDLKALGERQIRIDCDVIQADGGTRTAAISGAFVALYEAVLKLKNNYNINKNIIKENVAAVSVGIIDNKCNLDLNYEEDMSAQVDSNFVFSESGKIIEIQCTGEEYTFEKNQFEELYTLAEKGAAEIIQKQKETIKKIQ